MTDKKPSLSEELREANLEFNEDTTDVTVTMSQLCKWTARAAALEKSAAALEAEREIWHQRALAIQAESVQLRSERDELESECDRWQREAAKWKAAYDARVSENDPGWYSTPIEDSNK